MIFNSEPKNWQELQIYVSKIFTDCGCENQIEKDIETVRGKVNIDVYVVDTLNTPNSIYLCECKYWNNAIPKSVVHSFRSVVSDSGAHHGFLIAKKGFQSGAYEASSSTNLSILSWNEFQEMFYKRWLETMTENIKDNIYLMAKMTSKDIPNLSSSQFEYREKIVIMTTRLVSSAWDGTEQINKLKIPIIYSDINPHEKIKFNSKYDFFHYVNKRCLDIIDDFNSFFSL